MPYYVFKLFTKRRMEEIGEFTGFAAAKKAARNRRAEAESNAEYQIKVMFAANSDEAKRLLSENRDPRPLGEDG